MLTQDQLAQLAQSFYDHILERERFVRASGAYFTEDGRANRAAYWGKVAQETRNSLGSNTLDHGLTSAQAAARIVGLNWADLDDTERQQCKEAIHRAGIDLAEALKARYEGNFEFEPNSKLLRHALTQPSPPISPPAVKGASRTTEKPVLSSLYPDFIATQLRRGSWKKQTANQADATYRLFIGVCGDRPIRDYGRGDAKNFRETAERMPWDYGKAAIYRGKSPLEIIAIQEDIALGEREEPLSQKTIKRHFSALSSIWDDACLAEEASENIFSGFKFSSGIRAVEQRKDWSSEELQALFQSPVWTGCRSEVHRAEPGSLVIRDDKFWVPLIGLFSGMRLEEICQLRTDDFGVENGIWFFDVKVGHHRQLKNRNSIRHVPIHSQLIAIGLLKQVERLGKGSKQIFPDLTPGGADDKFGHAFSKWFTRYRRDIGLYRC